MRTEQLSMQGQKSLAVTPADIGVLALGDGTNPRLGATETIRDRNLRFSGRQNLVDDGFPVHGGDYQDSIRCSQQHPDRLFKHNPDMDTLRARLKHARGEKRWSQTDLARESGVKQSFIGALESGGQATSGWLPELAHALEVDAYWLKTGKGPMRPGEALIAKEPRQSYPLSPHDLELAALINRIPETERKAMLAMLRTRFRAEDHQAQNAPPQNDALAGFTDVTGKPSSRQQSERK